MLVQGPEIGNRGSTQNLRFLLAGAHCTNGIAQNLSHLLDFGETYRQDSVLHETLPSA